MSLKFAGIIFAILLCHIFARAESHREVSAPKMPEVFQLRHSTK